MQRALVLFVLGACAADPSGSSSGGGKADGSEPTITFHSDYTERVTGTLLAGSPVRIRYDLDRVTDCRSDAWGVSGYAQFDGGVPVAFGVSRLANGDVVPVDAELELPASASHVAIWFEVNDKYGCHAYDSNEGANYQFDIDRHGLGAVLAWDAGGFSQSGAVHAGDKVVVHYDPARLATCEGSTGGHAAWGVSGHYQVDGGSVHDLVVSRAETETLVAADPTLTVPRGHDLAFWFEATNVWGCHAFDSAYGSNYHVTIE
ncbi:MAG: hypothetical protein JO257_11925 [Deltaproteobacteria bacterium]|nr:hypothetical protein [Deltaproteobacteria bacterium]